MELLDKQEVLAWLHKTQENIKRDKPSNSQLNKRLKGFYDGSLTTIEGIILAIEKGNLDAQIEVKEYGGE